MFLLRVVLLLSAHWVVSADLLDLFVEHMDEEMKTPEYKKHHHREPMRQHMRNKRSVVESPFFRIGNYRRQRLDVDENWSKSSNHSNKTYKNDGLEYPNKQEMNNEQEQYELLNAIDELALSKYENNMKELPISKYFQKDILKNQPKIVPKKYFTNEKYRIKASFDVMKRKRSVEDDDDDDDDDDINFSRSEILDENGDVLLEWDPSDENIVTFKVTARTLGYIGIGFNEKSHMKGADLILAWVNDHTQQISLLVRSYFYHIRKNILKIIFICMVKLILINRLLMRRTNKFLN